MLHEVPRPLVSGGTVLMKQPVPNSKPARFAMRRKNLYMPVIVVRRGDVKGCGMNDVIVGGEFDDSLKFNEHAAEQVG